MSAGVKPGYKHTEVGVIPEDWVIKRVSDIGQIKTGPFGTLLKAHEYVKNDGVPLISVGEIGEGEFRITERTPLIPPVVVKRLPQYVLKDGDIVFGRKGAVDRSVLVTVKENGWFLGSDGISLRPQRGHPPFIAWQFRTKQVRSWLQQNSVGTTMASLNQAVLNNVCIAIAPFHEQEAIASVLSDMDTLLSSLDQLIAKKRDIKQAAMQQLLTGQQRLPGFSEEWEVKRLGEVFSISTGQSKSAYITTYGNYWIVDMGSVSTDGKLIVSKATDFKGDFLNAGDLVMPKDDIGGGGIIGRAGYIDANETYVLSDHVYRLKANYGSPLYLSYAINGYRINSALRKKVIGSAQLGLSRKSVEEQEIPFPSFEEQTTIATILSDMDSELATLETRREKARQIKQGTMQELLTGRIRLSQSSLEAKLC